MTGKRLTSLDLLKGFLLLKLTVTHIGNDLGASFTAVTHLLGNWTFGTFVFAFGVGIGLSSRPPRKGPFFALLAVYFGQALLTLTLHRSATSASEAIGLLTLSGSSKYVGFLFPYIVFCGIRLVLGQSLHQMRPHALIIGSLALYGIGVVGHLILPHGFGSVLWGMFGPLTHLPLAVAGLLSAPYLRGVDFRSRRLWFGVGITLTAVAAYSLWKRSDGETFRGSGDPLYLCLSAALALSLIVIVEAASKTMRPSVTLAAIGRSSLTMMAACTIAWNLVDTPSLQGLGNFGATVLSLVAVAIATWFTLRSRELAATIQDARQGLRNAQRRRDSETATLASLLSTAEMWHSQPAR